MLNTAFKHFTQVFVCLVWWLIVHFRSIWSLQSDIVIGECLYPVSVCETPFKFRPHPMASNWCLPNSSNKLPLNGKCLNLDISTCFHLYTSGLQFSLLRKGTRKSFELLCESFWKAFLLPSLYLRPSIFTLEERYTQVIWIVVWIILKGISSPELCTSFKTYAKAVI